MFPVPVIEILDWMTFKAFKQRQEIEKKMSVVLSVIRKNGVLHYASNSSDTNKTTNTSVSGEMCSNKKDPKANAAQPVGRYNVLSILPTTDIMYHRYYVTLV